MNKLSLRLELRDLYRELDERIKFIRYDEERTIADIFNEIFETTKKLNSVDHSLIEKYSRGIL